MGRNKFVNNKKHQQVLAKKSLGQNFLQDISVVEHICESTKIAGKTILEVGPGTGFLTKQIIKSIPKELILIEKDSRMIDILNGLIAVNQDVNIKLFNEDAQMFNLFEHFDKKITIIANLPYNIGTTLVMNWVEQIEQIEQMVLMLQKEVVERLCAKPNSGDYGRISVLVQSVCGVEHLFDVRPECFNPQPKVMSAVVKITPKQAAEQPTKEEYKYLSLLCKIAFSQRRKKLVNVLKNDANFQNIFKNFDIYSFIPSDARAENITVREYLKIVREFLKTKPTGQ